MQAVVEDELKEVEPLIAKARSAVGNLKNDNINEIRSLKAPPSAIRDVLEAVLRLMGQTDTSWNNMKRFLASKGVKEQIVNFEASMITPQVWLAQCWPLCEAALPAWARTRLKERNAYADPC